MDERSGDGCDLAPMLSRMGTSDLSKVAKVFGGDHGLNQSPNAFVDFWAKLSWEAVSRVLMGSKEPCYFRHNHSENNGNQR
jgi:hypothetical protein